MTTTSLKLPEDVKQLAAEAARRQGVSQHAFMVEAIRAAAVAGEKRARFIAEAVTARKEVLKSGKGFAVADVHGHFKELARGKSTVKPKLKSWRK